MKTLTPLSSSSSATFLKKEAVPKQKLLLQELTQSTLAPAPLPPPFRFEMSKPQLTSPHWRLVRNMNELSGICKQKMDAHEEALDRSQEQLLKMRSEKLKKIEEAANKTLSGDTWSLLKKIGVCILSATSVLLGISLVSTGGGTLLGGLLIASGILSIVNLVFVETGVWDFLAKQLSDKEETRKKIAAVLPAVVGLISAAVGIAGSAGALIWVPLTFSQQLLRIGQLAVNFAEGAAMIGEGASRNEVLLQQAEIKQLEKEINLHELDLRKTMGSFEKVMKLLSSSYEKAAHIIKISTQTQANIILQG